MARVVVWAKRDNNHPDFFVDATKFKPGMVVDILEDGQEAGKAVEASPWWRIIETPGVPKADLVYLLARDLKEPDDDQRNIAKMLRKRITLLDLDAIEQEAGIIKPGDEPARAITVVSKQALSAKEIAVVQSDNPLVFVPIEDI